MKLQIFDVEHGACSLLTADNNARLMIDRGHNATTGWKPGTYLAQPGRAGFTNFEIVKDERGFG
jgi:hypothetical protein